ncbi:hypothetical protein OC845_006775, partial [Tilletia horrida]
MSALWSVWSLIPDDYDLKTATADLITSIARRGRINFPRSSSLRNPRTFCLVTTDWSKILHTLGLVGTVDAYLRSADPASMHEEVQWVRSSPSRRGRPYISSTLYILRAGHVLADCQDWNRYVLQGTILVFEWDSVSPRVDSAFMTTTSFLDSLSSFTARVM